MVETAEINFYSSFGAGTRCEITNELIPSFSSLPYTLLVVLCGMPLIVMCVKKGNPLTADAER